MQQCFSDMNSGSRCRLYRHIKDDFQLEPYLRKNYNRDLRQCLTNIRLSSHKLYIERGRWQNQKLNTAIDYVPCVNKEILKTNTMF